MDYLVQKKVWIKEYCEKKEIASSTTNKPEKCIAWFRQWLRMKGFEKGRMLDVGCGLGRNSIPFLKEKWTVTAQDIVPQALKGYADKVSLYKEKLILVEQSVSKKIPYSDNSFDAAIEITVADNILTKSKQKLLWSELARVIKPHGYLLSYYFTKNDGFYGNLLKQQKPENKSTVYDEAANMMFNFYSATDIAVGSKNAFDIRCAKHYRYPGEMHNENYQRDLMAVIFENMKIGHEYESVFK